MNWSALPDIFFFEFGQAGVDDCERVGFLKMDTYLTCIGCNPCRAATGLVEGRPELIVAVSDTRVNWTVPVCGWCELVVL